MFDFLEYIPWYFAVVVVFFGGALIAVFGLLSLRYLINTKKMKDHHDVAGFTFGIIGVMYAVLLSYIVVDVHDRYNEIRQNIDIEANLVLELYRDSEVFSNETKTAIKGLIHQYLEMTIREDFPEDGSIKQNEKIENVIKKLWNEYYSYEIKSEKDKIWYGESVRKLNEFNRVRLLRLFNNNESIGTMMWTMLILGACITVSFMYFFRVEDLLFQVLMTTFLAGFVSLMLFLIQSLDTPFYGDIHVLPTHFSEVLQQLNQTEKVLEST